ncbi:PREDICTED: atrial natriuretic peptide receptor 2-like [Rhagoletis zephyria]|uniref:atrial natriuretic peptide receptor 2-like n=1 Tax=Rhagoletis zephyria TaxID=28612 RepID=UPI000811A3FE|nr:PREDICTED: atrial natriuretic peptide receptor 2-like [Rhagoletis zephyria]
MHAKEIAMLAFEMLDTVAKYKIKHLPKTKLRLRIGLHSGPVSAGVVGLKMPKYLVFGETVSTAQKMEASGEPMRIHVSKTCKEVLDSFGMFQFSERSGEGVDVGGKVSIKTYWLEALVEAKPQQQQQLLRRK